MSFKHSTSRMLVMAAFFLFVAAQLASSEYVLNGPGSAKLVLDSEKFTFDMDYAPSKAFYSEKKVSDGKTTVVRKDWTFNVGGCSVPFHSKDCEFVDVDYHIIVDDKEKWAVVDHVKGTVEKEKIVFDKPSEHKDSDSVTKQCSVKFEKDPSYPGKFVVDVRLEGKVGDKVVTKFAGADLYTTSKVASTEVPTEASIAEGCNCNSPYLIWSIVLGVILVILLLLALVLSSVIAAVFRRSKKPDPVKPSARSTVQSNMSTVQKPLVNETNVYGPDMMYFNRDAKPTDVSQVAPSPGPAPTTSPVAATPQ